MIMIDQAYITWLKLEENIQNLYMSAFQKSAGVKTFLTFTRITEEKKL